MQNANRANHALPLCDTHYMTVPSPVVVKLEFLQLEEDQQSLQHESARRGPSANVIDLPSSGISEHTEWRWARSTKASIPTRSYFREIATTIFVPVVLLLVLGALLSTAFCLHHEKM